MHNWWKFVADPDNQRTLKFVGTAVAVVVVAAWTLFVYLRSEAEPSSGERVSLSVERFLEITEGIQERTTSRFETELKASENDAKRLDGLRKLHQRELDILRGRERDQRKAIAELEQLLSEVRAVVQTPREVLSPDEIDVAVEHIEGGNIEAAKSTLQSYADESTADAAEAHFLLGGIAEKEVDLVVAAKHYGLAVKLNAREQKYAQRENALYTVTIVYEYEMRDVAANIADMLSGHELHVRTDRWNDYKEDDDGIMRRWVDGPTFLYSEATSAEKVMVFEALIGGSLEPGLRFKHLQGQLRKHGTQWGFSPLSVFLWLPNP